MLTHSEMAELYELYVLGVLDAAERAEIDAHLRDGCEVCRAGVEQARMVTATLVGLAPVVPVPEALRDRTLRTVAAAQKVTAMPQRSPVPRVLGVALAASLLLAAALGYQAKQLSGELETAKAQREELRAALQTLSRGETRTAQFGRPEQPHGRVFVGRENGVVLVASNLPALQAGRTFELWLVPKAGNPTPAGLFRANAQGESVQISAVPISPDTAAVAVSVEPDGGSPAPSTTPIIVAPIGG